MERMKGSRLYSEVLWKKGVKIHGKVYQDGPGVLSVGDKYRIHARNHILESVRENELGEELTRAPENFFPRKG